jgi:toxin-antitoxin system PIN domain toxin
MKYLLDVNALLAAILAVHSRHEVADTWLRRKLLATCPLSELGFLRISTHPKAYNLSMAIARQALEAFVKAHKVEFVPADLPAIESGAHKSEAVTDSYLAEFAARRGMKLATLDTGITHTAVEVIR